MNNRETWQDDARDILLALFTDEAERVFETIDTDEVDTLCGWLCDVGTGELGNCGQVLWPNLFDRGGWVVGGLDADDCFSVSESAIVRCGGQPWEDCK